MPASTRSRDKATQSSVENFPKSKSATSSDTRPTSPSKKRKASSSDQAYAKKPTKVKKTGSRPELTKTITKDGSESKIIINRAPVLTLWAACVAHFLYPSIPWEPTALSAGAAIAAICAISKGRATGEMAEKDKSKDSSKDKHKHSDRDRSHSLSVMKFNLELDGPNGHAQVKGKPNKQSETSLRKKFGDEAYEATKNTFEQSLHQWKGDEQGLNNKAFAMYEKFRPNVKPGSQGWGRKGELDLDFVKSVVGGRG